LKGTFNNILDI